MNKRKLLTLAMTLCMVAILAVGGTLAYFSDSEQATNVMTIGNVEINIEERSYDPDTKAWKPFVNGSLTLYPVDHTDVEARKETNQYFNKTVRTFNTSPSQDPAYIRTIIAIESIPYKGEWKTAVAANFAGCDFNVWPEYIELTDANGVKKTYDVYTCTASDEKPIAYGEFLPSLTSVMLYEDVTSEEAKAANDELDILVLSQGIQSAGLSHAEAMEQLGTVDQANLQKWFFGAKTEKAPGANVNEGKW